MGDVGRDPWDSRHLWLAHVELTMMDPKEELQSFLIAAPDRIAAEARLRDLLGPIGPRILKLGELVDDIARVWGRDGEPYDGTFVQGSDSD